jgi:hypothetical protein
VNETPAGTSENLEKKKYNKHCDFRDTIKTYQMLEFDGC